MKPTGQGVTVVGDDAQSIYSFRGATVRNILDFPHQFTQPARVVTLERNYRSTQPILDASNAVIAAARERHAKNLFTDKASSQRAQLVLVPDEAQQARWVADQVLRQREAGSTLKSQAVLFRTSHHSAALELELARRNIPFVKFGGLKFLEAAHIKDVMAVLRFAQNPRGRMAGFRVAQLVPGIGAATATRLLDAMAEASDPHQALQAFEPPAQAKDDWTQLATLSRKLNEPSWPGPPTWNWPRPGTCRSSSACTTTRRCASSMSNSSRGWRRLRQPRALPDRAHARSAGSDQRPERAAAARRGLPDPVHDPQRQGAGVEGGARAERASTAASPATWPPARPRNWKRSAGCCTSR
jgi:hypothetical protein